MSHNAAGAAAQTHVQEPASSRSPAPGALEVERSAAALDLERRLAGAEDRHLHLRQLTASQRHQTILGVQRTIGNHTVQRLIREKPPVVLSTTGDGHDRNTAIHRQTLPAPPPSMIGSHTITDPDAAIRGDPPDFKPAGKNIPVGTRVDVAETQTSTKGRKGTFANVAEHGTGNRIGWTSTVNLGDVKYANAAASFVYMATVKPRKGRPGMLPVMVYVPPQFDGTRADIVLYFHGDAADYSAGKANNYDRENPAIGMNLPGIAIGAHQIVIAPQGNEWTAGGDAISTKSPWATLSAGDYESIVQTVLTNLRDDLKFTAAIPRGAISIAGHSGGGKALGQAVQDLSKTDDGVKDVTLVEAGYGGGEFAKGRTDGPFARSFQMVRDWLLEGQPDKVLRVITKASSPGTDTRHAIENNPHPAEPGAEAGRTPVLSVDGVKNAIKDKGRDGELQADATEVATDPKTRTGGMHLIRTIVVSQKAGGETQGTIYVFLMTDPPRDKTKVDAHFGVRNATIGDIVSGQGKGADFAVH